MTDIEFKRDSFRRRRQKAVKTTITITLLKIYLYVSFTVHTNNVMLALYNKLINSRLNLILNHFLKHFTRNWNGTNSNKNLHVSVKPEQFSWNLTKYTIFWNTGSSLPINFQKRSQNSSNQCFWESFYYLEGHSIYYSFSGGNSL